MEAGEYIRTKDGQIGKVIEIKKRKELADQIYLDIRCNDEFYNVFVYDFDIKLYSKNIRDLIEAGDIVNGEKVITIDYNEGKIGICMPVDDYACATDLDSIHIETILTHEMYEQNCYKVGEEI